VVTLTLTLTLLLPLPYKNFNTYNLNYTNLFALLHLPVDHKITADLYRIPFHIGQAWHFHVRCPC